MYLSIAADIGDNAAYLHRINKQFWQLLKEAKRAQPPTQESTFAQSAVAQQKHSCPKGHWINTTLWEELRLLIQALQSPRMKFRTPIAHLVRRDPSADAWSDSSLRAAGGYSVTMHFWWYLEWPASVHKRTLIYIRNNAKGSLVSINVLEYVALLITYAGAIHFYKCHSNKTDPSPLVLFYVDNTVSEFWGGKACTSSLIGQALSRLQCAMMINNSVAIQTAHITTQANVIMDRISRITNKSNVAHDFPLIQQDFPELNGCKRFHPSASLISPIMDATS